MAEYFLPDVTALHALPCRYETRLLRPAEFAAYYTPQWANALCAQRRELDVLAMGAFDGQTLVGLAGCSADCSTMWQIGVDVLAPYRRQGIASALTSGLAVEALRRGLVPFYCCAWANVKSARNAWKSGLSPRMGAADGKADPRKKAGLCLKHRCCRGAKLFLFLSA